MCKGLGCSYDNIDFEHSSFTIPVKCKRCNGRGVVDKLMSPDMIQLELNDYIKRIESDIRDVIE